MSFSTTTVRKAAKGYQCDGCKSQIQAGDMYADHVASPGYVDNDHWWHLRECRPCCERYDWWPS